MKKTNLATIFFFIFISLNSSVKGMILEKKNKIIEILEESNKVLRMLNKEEAEEHDRNLSALKREVQNKSLEELKREAELRLEAKQKFIEREKNKKYEIIRNDEKIKDNIEKTKNALKRRERLSNEMLKAEKRFIGYKEGERQPTEFDIRTEIKRLKQEELKAYKYILERRVHEVYDCDLAYRMLRKHIIELQQLFSQDNQQETNQNNIEIVDYGWFFEKKEKPITREKNYKPNIVHYYVTRMLDEEVQVILLTSPILRDLLDFYNRFEIEKNDIDRSPYKRILHYMFSVLNDKLSNVKLYISDLFGIISEEESPKEMFAIIISTNNENLDLKKLGLRSVYTQATTKENIFNKLSSNANQELYNWFIEKMLSPLTEEEKKNNPIKIGYFTGHGGRSKNLQDIKKKVIPLETGTYAGIKQPVYQKITKCLVKNNFFFSFFFTCNSGDWNCLRMHEKAIGMAMGIGSISDHVSRGSCEIKYTNFKAFYENIRSLITTGIPYSQWPSNVKFKTALKSVLSPKLANIPSFCAPDDIFFRIIDIRNNLRTIRPKEEAPVRALHREKAFLFYDNTTNAFIVGNIPILLSKIPGPAHHILNGAKTSQNFKTVLNRVIGELRIVSPKMFFMEELHCKSCNEFKTISDLENLDIKNFYYMTRFEVKENNIKHIYFTGSGLLKNPSYFPLRGEDIWFFFAYDTERKRLFVQKINKEIYAQNIIRALGATMPTKEAVFVNKISNNILLENLENNQAFYNFDEAFIEKMNKCLEQEELKVYLVKEIKFRGYKIKGPGFIEKIKISCNNMARTIFSFPVINWLGMQNYFNSDEKMEEEEIEFNSEEDENEGEGED